MMPTHPGAADAQRAERAQFIRQFLSFAMLVASCTIVGVEWDAECGDPNLFRYVLIAHVGVVLVGMASNSTCLDSAAALKILSPLTGFGFLVFLSVAYIRHIHDACSSLLYGYVSALFIVTWTALGGTVVVLLGMLVVMLVNKCRARDA
jgi:hypothetical protein